MDSLSKLFMPQLEQLGARIVYQDKARWMARFDNDIAKGTFLAIKAEDDCLIVRHEVLMLKNFDLREHKVDAFCITSTSSDQTPAAAPSPAAGDAQPAALEGAKDLQHIAVYTQPAGQEVLRLQAGKRYDTTIITYLPAYFDRLDLPGIGTFREVASAVSLINEHIPELRLRSIFDELDLRNAQRPTGRFYYRSKATQAVCHVMDMVYELNYLREMGVEGEDLRLVREIITMIESSLDNVPSIQELSRAMFVGHTRMCETFKRATGMTIGQYARKRRIEHAQVLLRNGEIPIKEIARRTSFSSPESFSTAFKKTTGTTPREYRKATRYRMP